LIRIKIDPEFRDLIPPLSVEEQEQLETSILADGVRDPLVVWGRNGSSVLVEGHHRWTIICKHKIKDYRIVEKTFSDREEAKIWIIDNQCGRRNLPLFTKCLLQIQKMEMSLRQKAKENQGRRTDLSMNASKSSSVHVDQSLAKAAGVSPQTIQRVRFLAKNADEDVLKILRRGEISIREAFTDCRKKVLYENAAERLKTPSILPDSMKIIAGDALEEMRKMPSESFDAILTDPPYGVGFRRQGKNLEEHDDPKKYGEWLKPIVAEMDRLLRPGGFLAVFQSGKNFRYLWDWFGNDIFIYAHCRSFVQIHLKMPINFGFDPVAIKYKIGASPLRPLAPKRPTNFYVSHLWEQYPLEESLAKLHPCPRPLDQMEELVTNFVLEGGIVLDPFTGSGTTGVACLKHGRQFVGIERDKKHVNLARKRMAETLEPEYAE